MKIAVVGSNGYIAEQLINRLSALENVKEILKIGRQYGSDYFLELIRAELFDYSMLEQVDYIIFTAAISSPDICANEYEKSWNINVRGTSYFINQAIQKGCRVLFFSSDAVYGDKASAIYLENENTESKMAYGMMKKAIEDEFKDNMFFKALRLSYVISRKDKFVSYCFKCIENKETAEIFHPFYRNCITLSDVCKTVIWMLNNWEKFKPVYLNVAGGELVSRVRIADEINRITNNRLDYRIVCPDEKFYFNRPKITQMSSLYIKEILGSKSFTQAFQEEINLEYGKGENV